MRTIHAKRLVALILTVCTLLSVVSLPALASEGPTGTDFSRIYIATDSDDVSIFAPNDLTVRCAHLFDKEYVEIFGKKLLVTFGSSAYARSGDIVLVMDSTLPIPDQGYSVSVVRSMVTVSASTAVGLLYGCREVMRQLKINGFVTAVEESPSVATRALRLDVGEGDFSADAIMTLIREMSWVNMNTLILYFSEESGVNSRLLGCFDGCDGEHFLIPGDGAKTAALTHAEIHEIVRLAALYNVELVPTATKMSYVRYTDPTNIYQSYDPAATGNVLPLGIENPNSMSDAEILADKLPLLRAYGVKCWKHNVNQTVSYDAYTTVMDKLGASPALTLPDVSDLDVLVAEYKILKAKELIYTASSFENYESSIRDARQCIGAGYFFFTQTQINNVVATVRAAKKNLVKLPSDNATMERISSLRIYIATYSEDMKNIYTLDSWHMYSSAIYAAKVVLDGRNYTAQDIKDLELLVLYSFMCLCKESQVSSYRIDGLTSANFRTAKVRMGGTAQLVVTTPRHLNLTGVVVVDENGEMVARGTEMAYNRRQPTMRNFTVYIPATEMGTHTYTVYGVVNDTRVYTGFLYTNDPITCKITVIK